MLCQTCWCVAYLQAKGDSPPDVWQQVAWGLENGTWPGRLFAQHSGWAGRLLVGGEHSDKEDW